MKIGNHKRVFEYDGSYKCLDCQARWGALSNAPPDAPIECVALADQPQDSNATETEREYLKKLLVALRWACADMASSLGASDKVVMNIAAIELDVAVDEYLQARGQSVPGNRIQELEAAIKDSLSWIECRYTPPVREEIPCGTMVRIRLHALADLHKALYGEYATPRPVFAPSCIAAPSPKE